MFNTIKIHFILLFFNYMKIFFSGLLIFSLISSYSFSAMFIEIKSWWLKFESVKSLQIKTSTLVNLVFAKILFYRVFFLFLFVIDLCFLIPAVIPHIFNPSEHVIHCWTCNSHRNTNGKSKSRNWKTTSKCRSWDK